MTRRRAPYGKVYRLLDDDSPAIVRYSGDPDEYYALAHAWLIMNGPDLFYDHPIALGPPSLQWFRMNPYPGDDYAWTLGFPAGPGRGNWRGSYLTVVKIGCSECQYLNGTHHPGGCLNEGVTGLTTCMLTPAKSEWMQESTRRRAKQMIHLVRSRPGGTPGHTLCDIDRFGPGVSFDMGGGYTWQGVKFTACYMCVRSAKRDFPGLPVSTSMREFAQLFIDQAVPIEKTWAELAPTLGTPGAWALAR